MRFDDVSRWNVFLEARDSLRSVLAPPLALSHLLAHGRELALSLRVRRPTRPMQLANIRRVFKII